MSCTTVNVVYSYEAVKRYVSSKDLNVPTKLVESCPTKELSIESPFDELPVEMVCHVLQYIDQTEYSFLSRLVCKLWSILIRTPKKVEFSKIAELYIHNFSAILRLELQWPRTFLAKCATSMSILAADLGYTETLKWIRSQGYQWSEEISAVAAKAGHSKLLVWLYENECQLNETTFAKAVSNGCLDTLKWLRTTDCPMDEDSFTKAAKNGNTQILEWLKNEKCPWNEDAYIAAIGKLDTLKWLRMNDCPWSDRVSLFAARRKQWKTLEWLEANGCPMHQEIEISSQ